MRLGYHDHSVVDESKAWIIPTALVTPAEIASAYHCAGVNASRFLSQSDSTYRRTTRRERSIAMLVRFSTSALAHRVDDGISRNLDETDQVRVRDYH